MNNFRWIQWSARVWIVLFWTGLFILPVTAVFVRGFATPSQFFDPVVLFIACQTFKQALLSTVFSVVLGCALGLIVQTSRGARLLLSLPWGIPTVVAAIAWVRFLPPQWNYSLSAVVTAHVFYNAPWVSLLVAQALDQVPRNQMESARTLGASRLRAFQNVAWTYIRPALLHASAQVFAVCAASFALVMILGGGPPVETLETAIYWRVHSGESSLGQAGAAAVWQCALTLVPCWLLYFVGGPLRVAPAELNLQKRSKARWLWILCGVWFIPYLSLFSTVPKSMGIEVLQGARISLSLALGAAIVSVMSAVSGIIVCVSSSRREFLASLLLAPSGVSTLVLALGVWLAYGSWVDPFEGSLTVIILVQGMLSFPMVFRVLWPLVYQFSKKEFEAARSLGASPLRAIWVSEAWRWKGPLKKAFAWAGALALGEVAVVSFFYADSYAPLPLLISRLSAQYRFAESQTVAILLLILCMMMISLSFEGKRR